MEITSLSFGVLVIVCLVIYYFLPKSGQNGLLLLASYVFYAACAWQFALILAGLTLFNYLIAFLLQKRAGKMPVFLWVGILGNIGTVMLFKYYQFFAPKVIRLLQHLTGDASLAMISIAVPLGLSYRLLEYIAYLLDVHRGQLKAERNIVHFALFSAFFPKLVAGPIERAKPMLARIASPRAFSEESLSTGFALIMLGLVRKLVLADVLSNGIPASIFTQPALFSPPQLLLSLVVYVFVLYNDFAGYTDIARGVAKLFGFDLTPNFKQPFFSRTFSELWLRWHTSLSFWLRDYIFMPLSRALLRRIPNPLNLFNRVLPLLVTMLVSGLWHKIKVESLIWGALMGAYLVSGRIYSMWRRSPPPDQRPLWRQFWGMGMVMSLFCLAVIAFRVDMDHLAQFVRALGNWKNTALPGFYVFFMMAVSLLIDFFQYRSRDEVVFLRWPSLLKAFLLAVALLAVFLATRFRPAAPFIYQGF